MSNIDKQRIAAVRKLECLGYTFADGDWHAPAGIAAPTPTSPQADAMRAVLTCGSASSALKTDTCVEVFRRCSTLRSSSRRDGLLHRAK